jgi:CBS domain-containing protein
VNHEIRLFLLVILAAGVGSYIHAATSFATYVGNKSFVASWTWWYLLRPFIGVALALVFYFVIRGGLLSVQSDPADFSPYGIAAVAGMVGIFSKQATDKLEEVFTNLFRTEPGKGDDKRRNKLRDAIPVTDAMVPLRKIRKVVLPTGKTASDVKLADLFKILNEGFTRVPIFDESNICRYVIHQSLIYRFVARKSIEAAPPQSLDLGIATLEDLLAFENVTNYVRDALAFVSPTATLGEAQAEMDKNEDCQDILVTTTGTSEGPVVGWLTNADIVRHIKA